MKIKQVIVHEAVAKAFVSNTVVNKTRCMQIADDSSKYYAYEGGKLSEHEEYEREEKKEKESKEGKKMYCDEASSNSNLISDYKEDIMMKTFLFTIDKVA
ncbi:hypothetical protein PR048_012749, partial [Dryococelus australis]